MGRYYRWGRCLDCQLEIGDLAVCPRCGLAQTGPEADRVRWLLGQTDIALHAARVTGAAQTFENMFDQPVAAGGVPAREPQLEGAEPAMAGHDTALPEGTQWQHRTPWPQLSPMAPPPPPPVRVSSSWPALTTPVVLLGLGAISVLIAAIVFVSVAWSDLSLAAKAAILLSITAGIGSVAAWTLRRGLRGGAESLTMLTLVLVVVDFVAAVEGGLFGLGDVSDSGVGWTSALILLTGGVAWGVAATRTKTRRLTGSQLFAVLGVVWLVAKVYGEQWERPEFVAFGLVMVLLALAMAGARLAVWTFASWMIVVAALNLLTAFALSLGHVLATPDVVGLWGNGRAIGWLVCMALAVVAASTRWLPMTWRTPAAAVAVVGVELLVLRPLEGSNDDLVLACLAAACGVVAFATLFVRPPWLLGCVVGAIPTGVLVAETIAFSVAYGIGVIVAPAAEPWTLEVSDRPVRVLDPTLVDPIGSPWLVGVAAVVLMASAYTIVVRRPPRLVPAVLMVSGAGAVVAMRYSMPLWAMVAVLAGLAAATSFLAVVRRSGAAAMVSAGFAVLALVASLGSDVTTLLVACVLALVLAGLAWRLPDALFSSLAAGAAVLFAGLAIAAGLDHADLRESVTPYALVGLAAVVVVAAQIGMQGTPHRSRPGLELGAVAVGVIGIGLAASFSLEVQTPIALTIAGASLVAVSLVSEDRRRVSIAGGVLLASATWVRLAAVGVTTVEAYTLPTAVALLALGAIRMVRVPGSSSITTLTGGLSLALLPSLLATLPDPTSSRALLLGIGALGVLLAGGLLRWVAPLLFGGGVLLVLLVINVAPYAHAIPRWVLFALLGAALLFLGITWERRLRDARSLLAAVERLA